MSSKLNKQSIEKRRGVKGSWSKFVINSKSSMNTTHKYKINSKRTTSLRKRQKSKNYRSRSRNWRRDRRGRQSVPGWFTKKRRNTKSIEIDRCKYKYSWEDRHTKNNSMNFYAFTEKKYKGWEHSTGRKMRKYALSLKIWSKRPASKKYKSCRLLPKKKNKQSLWRKRSKKWGSATSLSWRRKKRWQRSTNKGRQKMKEFKSSSKRSFKSTTIWD